jgi:uncharacterized MAPEG superfamily protein
MLNALHAKRASRYPVNVPFLCVFIAFSLIYVTKIPAAIAMAKSAGGYDNRTPRDQQGKLEGWGKRAMAAHLNGFESFAPFAAAVLIAHLMIADPGKSTTLAVVHVVARAVYPAIYIADVHWLRSLVWLVGFGATVGLFVVALF